MIFLTKIHKETGQQTILELNNDTEKPTYILDISSQFILTQESQQYLIVREGQNASIPTSNELFTSLTEAKDFFLEIFPIDKIFTFTEISHAVNRISRELIIRTSEEIITQTRAFLYYDFLKKHKLFALKIYYADFGQFSIPVHLLNKYFSLIPLEWVYKEKIKAEYPLTRVPVF